MGVATMGLMSMTQQSRPQQSRPHPSIRRDSLVLLEFAKSVRAGLVMDDDVRNPIRLVKVGDEITGVQAAELELADRETYEMAIYLEGSRRDGSGDMAMASQAACFNR